MSKVLEAAQSVVDNPTVKNIVKLIDVSGQEGVELGAGGNRTWNNFLESVNNSLVVEVKPEPEPEPIVEPERIVNYEPETVDEEDEDDIPF